jgi:hypothetical protein
MFWSSRKPLILRMLIRCRKAASAVSKIILYPKAAKNKIDIELHRFSSTMSEIKKAKAKL